MKKYYALTAVLLFAVLVRLFFVCTVKESFSMDPDSGSYETIARSIIDRGTLTPSAVRTPGYPAFLAAIHTIAGNGPRPVIVVQAIISAITVLLVFLIARKLWNEKTGVVAAALAAVDPFQVYFAGKVLAETLFIFLLCLIVYVFIVAGERGRVGMPFAAATGFLCGLSALVRPELSGLAFLMVLAWGAMTVRKVTAVRQLSTMLVMVLTVMAVLVPWGLRNRTVIGRFVMSSTNGGWTMYEGLAQDYSIAGWDRYRQEHMVADVEKYHLDTELRINDHFARKSRDYIRAHPVDYLTLAVRKCFKLYRVVPYEVFSAKARAASAVYFGPLLLAALIGAAATGKQAVRLLPVYAPLVFITGLHMLFTSQIRYRVPLHPLMALFAAYALTLLFERYTERKTGQ